MAMVEIHLEQTIAAPVEQVFDWMTDPATLVAAPLVFKAGLTFTASGEGTHVDWLTNYSHPIWAGGRLLEALTRRLLRSSFRSIFAAGAREQENQAA